MPQKKKSRRSVTAKQLAYKLNALTRLYIKRYQQLEQEIQTEKEKLNKKWLTTDDPELKKHLFMVAKHAIIGDMLSDLDQIRTGQDDLED